MTVLSARQQIQYAGDSSRRLLLEQGEPGGFTTPVIDVHLYPPVAAKLAASVGTVSSTAEIRTRQVSREIVKFSGTDRAQLKWPVTTLISAVPTTVLFDRNLQPLSSNIGAALDPVSGELVISQPAYGGLIVAYDATYRVLEYRPDTSLPRAIRYGTVLALYQTAVETLAIEVGGSTADNLRELYVAYSTYIADEGLSGWETPPGWPDNAEYPLPYPEGTPDPDASATRERPHRIGYYDTLGRVYRRDYHVSILKPYTGSYTYHPAVFARFAAAPPAGSDYEAGYRQAISEKSDILADLRDEYTNFQGER